MQAGRKMARTATAKASNEGEKENAKRVCTATAKASNEGEKETTSQCSAEEKSFVGWRKPHSTVWWNSYGAHVGKPKIAAFDMDGTLIQTKSGHVFAKDRSDWKFFGAVSLTPGVVKAKLRKLVVDGYKLVIFTNQKGVTTGAVELSEITGKIDDIQKDLDIPMQAFVFTDDDIFRKPCTGGWRFALSECNDGKTLDLSQCFYVGDAAGRPAGPARKKKDHSADDLKFALNIGITFHTPEGFFFGETDTTVPKAFEFDPRVIGKQHASLQIPPGPDTGIEVVVLVGPPGSGKTTMASRFFSNHTRVNQDTLKSKDKCLAACNASLAGGTSCVIDNQNKDRGTRRLYINAAAQHGASVRCIFMDVPKALCFHLNAYRMLNPRTPEHRKHKVPSMVIHSFYKNHDSPREEEGYTSVQRVTLDTFQAGPFDDPEDEQLFHSFLD